MSIFFENVHRNFAFAILFANEMKTSFVSPCLRHLGANKTGFNLIIVDFYPAESCL